MEPESPRSLSGHYQQKAGFQSSASLLNPLETGKEVKMCKKQRLCTPQPIRLLRFLNFNAISRFGLVGSRDVSRQHRSASPHANYKLSTQN